MSASRRSSSSRSTTSLPCRRMPAPASSRSGEAGVDVLAGAAPDDERFTPRYIALVTWLDHQLIFDRALSAAAFLVHSSKLERDADREDVEPRHHEEGVQADFAEGASLREPVQRPLLRRAMVRRGRPREGARAARRQARHEERGRQGRRGHGDVPRDRAVDDRVRPRPRLDHRGLQVHDGCQEARETLRRARPRSSRPPRNRNFTRSRRCGTEARVSGSASTPKATSRMSSCARCGSTRRSRRRQADCAGRPG